MTPGPGAYQVTQNFITPKSKNKDFQFFGSSVERFADHPMNSLEVEMKSNIGPCTYKVDKHNSI